MYKTPSKGKVKDIFKNPSLSKYEPFSPPTKLSPEENHQQMMKYFETTFNQIFDKLQIFQTS